MEATRFDPSPATASAPSAQHPTPQASSAAATAPFAAGSGAVFRPRASLIARPSSVESPFRLPPARPYRSSRPTRPQSPLLTVPPPQSPSPPCAPGRTRSTPRDASSSPTPPSLQPLEQSTPHAPSIPCQANAIPRYWDSPSAAPSDREPYPRPPAPPRDTTDR